MTFILKRRSPYVFALFPFNIGSIYDNPEEGTYSKALQQPTTSTERFRNIFRRDEFGSSSPELHYCIHLTTMGLVIGGFYGGIIRGKSAFFKFIDNNEASIFLNHLEAKRKLQDTMSYNVFKGAIQWGWRTALFTSIYALVSTSVSVFRGKSGIIEHIDGGLVAGALYNMKNGIRGVIVGGALGSILGAFFGTISYIVLILTGKTMEDVRFYTTEWRDNRTKAFVENDRKRRLEKDEEEILKLAEVVVGEESH